MSPNKKLAIIIVNWKQYDLTKKCLLSINKTKFNNYKIILVDNESSEKKLNVFLNDFNNLKVIQNKLNLGFGVANNQAITYALDKNYDYVMLLNNDTEVDQNFIIPLIDCFEKNNSIGGVQPLIMNYNKRDSIWSAGGYINKFFGNTTTNKSLEKKLDLDWITGCCML